MAFREGRPNKKGLGQLQVGVTAREEAELAERNGEIAAEGRGFQEGGALASSF